MSARLTIIITLLAIVATLSSGTASPPSDHFAGIVASVALATSSETNVAAQLAPNQVFDTSVVVLISFQHKDVGKVSVLFGPTLGASEPAQGFITTLGGFHVERGFAYMKYTKPASAADAAQTATSQTAAAGTPTTQPANSRPYIRTKRVNAVGEGTAWAVEVCAAHDRIYFVEGTKVECASRIVPRFTKSLMETNKKSFTTLVEHSLTTATDPFSAESRYEYHPDASEFAAYIDGFKAWSYMPDMQ